MAQKTIVTLVDDLTGEQTASISTVEFALDGMTYKLDLTDENRAKLRDALSPYANAGRRSLDGAAADPAQAEPPRAPEAPPATIAKR